MQRMDRYRAVLDDMLARGLAYRCYTTPAELDAAARRSRWRAAKSRATTAAGGPRTRRAGRRRKASRRCSASAIPTTASSRGTTPSRARSRSPTRELDDLVIARADGTPTYNFCVVVDDLDMRITHVIRGDDHVNNTPRQINIMRALGATPPVYAHLPTVLDAGRRASCRSATARAACCSTATTATCREAIVNYLARLGWAHGDAEVFGVDEFVGWFDLAGLTPSPARFDPEKLRVAQSRAPEAARRCRARRADCAVSRIARA